MRRRSEPLTHVVQTPFFPFNRFRCKLEIRPTTVAEPSTDYSPARSGGLLSAPPCSPYPAPPKSTPVGCLSESITDCSPARSGGLLSAPPCSPYPAPPKSAAAFTKQPCDNMIRYTIWVQCVCESHLCEEERGRRSRQRADPARRPSRPNLRPTSSQPLCLPLHPPILPGCRAAPGIAGP